MCGFQDDDLPSFSQVEDILLIHNVPYNVPFCVACAFQLRVSIITYLLETALVPPDLQVISIAELVICEPLYSHYAFEDNKI